MNRLGLTLGALFVFAAPAISLAQTYDDQRTYPDDQGRYQQPTQDPDRYDRQAPYAGDSSRDSGYRGGDGRDDDLYRSGAHYTGRVGDSWTDAAGRRCRWREVTWQDRTDGNQAFKWITSCRD
jgi:hypothetical protein